MFAALFKAVESLPEGAPVATPPKPEIVASGLSQALSRGLWQHYLTGKWFATREIESSSNQPVPGAADPVPPLAEKFRAKLRNTKMLGALRGGLFAAQDPLLPQALLDAAASLESLGQTIPVTAAEVQTVANFYQELGQSVSGLIQADVQTIFEKLALGQKNGWSVREFQSAIEEAGLRYAGDLLSGQAGPLMSANHVETVYRNHMMRAFSDGKDSLADDPETGDIIAGWTFVATLDDRTRKLHADLDGVSLPKEKWDGQFKYLKPPIFHNCRCDREIVTIFDLERGHQWTDESKLPAYNSNEFF